jgi:nucleoside-diphosphate-sugar epimerase
LLHHPNITVFKGDVRDKQSLQCAIKGCGQVYHTAAKVGAWASDPSQFYEVNVEGTRNVLEAALGEGIEKLVLTSTSGLLGPSNGAPLREDAVRTTEFRIDYDRSKKMAEEEVVSYAAKGISAVIVSPSKVYGPGHTSHSLTANAIIDTFLRKGVTFIPWPGTYRVCFAYIDDVVNGHLLAMERGRPGEKYILGGMNLSYYDFFNRIRALAHCRASIIPLPRSVIKLWAHLQQLHHKLTGAPVRFPVSSVDHVFSHYVFSSEKAVQELGYRITPLDKAITQTIQFLKYESNQ